MRSSIQVQKAYDCCSAVCTNKGGHRDLDAFSNGANHCAFQEACSAGHQASSEAKDEVCSLS